jgi:prenyltransferase beta subunit
MALVELKMPTEKYTDPAMKFLAANAKTFEDIRIAAAGLEAVGKRSAEAEKWLETVKKMRNDHGTYGSGDGAARDTGSAVVTVLRLGGKVESEEAVVKVLNAGQRADGGFGKAGVKGSDLETTYRVVRCYVMLKEKPDVKKCLGFVARCRNADGGCGVEPGKPSNVAATYFAAILQHWLAEKP